MGTQANAAPVIIKRKKIIAGGHHGGAWKVAYADFVTAMMAFFMLMWLLNATTENQRKGLADYFAPTLPVSRVSGGSDGALGGDSIFSEDVMPRMGQGATSLNPTESNAARGAVSAEEERQAKLKQIEQSLRDLGQLGPIQAAALKHVDMHISDEGLVVELFDLPDAFLFEGETDQPTRLLKELSQMIQQAFSAVINPVAIEGHVAARSVVVAVNPVWELSMGRADRMRQLLQEDGVALARLARVTGHADRRQAVQDPMALRNNRLEVILLASLP
jgi:chemotaxis protein MotB